MNQIIMDLLEYFLEVTIISSVFYLLYSLFFNKKTFYKINRLVLLFAVLVSVFLPLIDIDVSSENDLALDIPSQKHELFKLTKEAFTEPATKSANQNQVIATSISGKTPVEIGEKSSVPWLPIIFSVYYLVGGFLLFRLILGIRKIMKIKTTGKNSVFDKTEVIITSHPSSFSFFNWIFIGQSKLDSPEFQTILTHELQHARNFHSVDVILFELLKCVFWFNPFFYLLANQSKLNNEYFTDKVLSLSLGIDQYTDALMSAFDTNQGNEDLVLEKPLINNFAFLSLKFRIMQLLKQPSGRNAGLSYTLIVPVLFMLFLAFSCNLKDDLLRTNNVKTVVAYYEDEFGDQQSLNGKHILEYDFEAEKTMKQAFYDVRLPGNPTLPRLLPFALIDEELSIIQYKEKWPEIFDDNNWNRGGIMMELSKASSEQVVRELSPDGFSRVVVKNSTGWVSFSEAWKKVELNDAGLWKTIKLKSWTVKMISELRSLSLQEINNDEHNKLIRKKRVRELDQDVRNLKTVVKKSFEYDSFNRLIKSTGSENIHTFSYTEEGNLRKIATFKESKLLRWFEIFYDKNNEINKVSAYNGNNDIEYSVLYEYTYY